MHRQSKHQTLYEPSFNAPFHFSPIRCFTTLSTSCAYAVSVQLYLLQVSSEKVHAYVQPTLHPPPLLQLLSFVCFTNTKTSDLFTFTSLLLCLSLDLPGPPGHSRSLALSLDLDGHLSIRLGYQSRNNSWFQPPSVKTHTRTHASGSVPSLFPKHSAHCSQWPTSIPSPKRKKMWEKSKLFLLTGPSVIQPLLFIHSFMSGSLSEISSNLPHHTEVEGSGQTVSGCNW